jgi:transcription-repair coupling factor (superfamily II helicase)
MEEAVAELKGEPLVQPLDPEINIPLSAFLSEAYVPDIDQRMTLYRRMSRITELSEIGDVRGELNDRFGPLPEEATNLLFKILLKVLARSSGIARLDIKDRRMVMYFSEHHPHAARSVVGLVLADPERYEISPDGVVKARLMHPGTLGQLAQAKNILHAIHRRVNSQEN